MLITSFAAGQKSLARQLLCLVQRQLWRQLELLAARARRSRACAAIPAAGAIAAAGPDFEAAGSDFEAAGPDFEAAGPDF